MRSIRNLSPRNKGIWRFRSRRARRPSYHTCKDCGARIKGNVNYFNHRRKHKAKHQELWGDLGTATLQDPTADEFEDMLDTWTRFSPLSEQVDYMFNQSQFLKGFQSKITFSITTEAGHNFRKRHANFAK